MWCGNVEVKKKFKLSAVAFDNDKTRNAFYF